MLVALLTAAAGLAAPPLTPELWRGAHAGMTVAQVQALFPEGRSAPLHAYGSTTTANMVAGGGGASWVVDEQVFGHPGAATYYFQGGKLLEVVVEVLRLRLRHTRDNVDIARDIRIGLTHYYGEPRACVDTARRGLDRLDCRWTTSSVQVGLSYADYGGLSPVLRVAVRSLPQKPPYTGATFSRQGQGHA